MALKQAIGVLKRALGMPPAFSKPGQEQWLLREYADRLASSRRAVLLIALIAWIAYGGWDVFHGLKNPSFREVLPTVLLLRAIGATLILFIVWRSFSDKFTDERHATILMSAAATGAYLILHLMMLVSPFPNNYLFYFTGNFLVLLFMFGLLRLRVRPIRRLMVFCLVVSAGILPYCTSMSPGELISISGPAKSEFYRLSSYYFWSATFYLVSFMFLAYILAVEHEYTARDEFEREIDLHRSYAEAEMSQMGLLAANQALEASKSEMETRTAALIKAKEQLADTANIENLNKSKYLGDAAHDLKQPIQALAFYIDAAAQAAATGELELCSRTLLGAKRSVRVAAASFNAVLELSQLESGFTKADLADFDIYTLVRDVAQSLSGFSEERDVDMRIRVANIPAYVSSDQVLLRRILTNLITNAVKHQNPENRGNKSVIVGVVCLPSKVRVDIVDNGVGISSTHYENIFKPFFQINNSAREREKGVGLGLSIVNAIIPLLPQHRIDMRSTEGRGRAFHWKCQRART